MQIEIKIENEITKKVDVRLWAAEEAVVGPLEHRPVILPPTGAGGGRCSVKPASRSFLHSRSHAVQAFARMSRLIS